jgi:hypothetical protein
VPERRVINDNLPNYQGRKFWAIIIFHASIFEIMALPGEFSPTYSSWF